MEVHKLKISNKYPIASFHVCTYLAVILYFSINAINGYIHKGSAISVLETLNIGFYSNNENFNKSLSSLSILIILDAVGTLKKSFHQIYRKSKAVNCVI